MPSLTTPRLLLLPLTVADADAVYRLYSDPVVCQHYAYRPIERRADTEDFIRRVTAGGNRVWSIRRRRAPGTMIGDCALHDWDEATGSLEIGGALLSEHWGKGLMQEAFTALIDWARTQWPVRAVIGRTASTNRQAVRLVEKLGFVLMEEDGHETVLRKVLEAV